MNRWHVYIFILGANIGSCTPAVMVGNDMLTETPREQHLSMLMFNVVGLVVIF
ncbi:MAG: hypothetical protein ACLUR5_17610 [Eubacterium ventriosum]